MLIKCRVAPGSPANAIPIKIKMVVRRICRALESHYGPISHPLKIYLVPSPTIEIDGICGFGLFRSGLFHNISPPTIWVGCGPLDLDGMEQGSDWHLNHIANIVLHEFAHYEQYRDGKKMCERGVPGRTAKLLRKIAPMVGVGLD